VQEILRYSTTDVLAPQWEAMEAGVKRAEDADQVGDQGVCFCKSVRRAGAGRTRSELSTVC